MCETNNQEQPKSLADLGEYDPAKVDGSNVVIEEVTEPVAVQIIGGVRPQPDLGFGTRGAASKLLDYGMDLSEKGRTKDALTVPTLNHQEPRHEQKAHSRLHCGKKAQEPPRAHTKHRGGNSPRQAMAIL